MLSLLSIQPSQTTKISDMSTQHLSIGLASVGVLAGTLSSHYYTKGKPLQKMIAGVIIFCNIIPIGLIGIGSATDLYLNQRSFFTLRGHQVTGYAVAYYMAMMMAGSIAAGLYQDCLVPLYQYCKKLIQKIMA